MVLTEQHQNEIKSIIASISGHDVCDITGAQQLEGDLGLDEFDVVELLMKIETHFNISSQDGEFDQLQKVSDVFLLVDKYINRFPSTNQKAVDRLSKVWSEIKAFEQEYKRLDSTIRELKSQQSDVSSRIQNKLMEAERLTSKTTLS